MKNACGRLGKCAVFLPVLLCISFLFLFPPLISSLQRTLFLSDPGLIGYSVPYHWNAISAPLGLIGGYLLAKAAAAPRRSGKRPLRQKLAPPAYLFLLVLATYVLTVSITTMTEDGLTRRSPRSPGGVSYSYGDVVFVMTGYLNEEHLQGVLYYRVCLSDGASADLLGADANSRTVSDLDRMDREIMRHGAGKTASSLNDTGRYTGEDAEMIARIFARKSGGQSRFF